MNTKHKRSCSPRPPWPPARRYSNERGTAADGARCDKGYWLVDDSGAETPLLSALKAFYASADARVRDHAAAAGAPPGLNDFRRWAVGELARLAGYGGSGAAERLRVRDVDAAAAAVGGGH
jgi:hypothetical protein